MNSARGPYTCCWSPSIRSGAVRYAHVVPRDDGLIADIVYPFPTTWQAYNTWSGTSVGGGITRNDSNQAQPGLSGEEPGFK